MSPSKDRLIATNTVYPRSYRALPYQENELSQEHAILSQQEFLAQTKGMLTATLSYYSTGGVKVYGQVIQSMSGHILFLRKPGEEQNFRNEIHIMDSTIPGSTDLIWTILQEIPQEGAISYLQYKTLGQVTIPDEPEVTQQASVFTDLRDKNLALQKVQNTLKTRRNHIDAVKKVIARFASEDEKQIANSGGVAIIM